MIRALLGVAAIFMAGCATTWVHPTANREQFEQAQSDCRQSIVPMVPAPSRDYWDATRNTLRDAGLSEQAFRQCMTMKGYTSN